MAATREHLELATFIKSVHKELRENAKSLGDDEAWIRHREKKDTLKKYAFAMQELATKHWEQNLCTSSNSRIIWVVHYAEEYFISKGLIAQRIREQEILKLLLESPSSSAQFTCNVTSGETLNLLDVGSCYNPFKVFKQFNVTAVDIAPANKDVLYCDFLNLKVVDNSKLNIASDKVEKLQRNSFHIVVFSLLLEYLPSSKQRILCCEKAYNLLMPEGLLIIITPDSKHVGANANLMKSWRFALAMLGFSRVKYEKLAHVHCLAFRKCLSKEFSYRWAKMHSEEGFSGAINIPQDFNSEISITKKNCDDENLTDEDKLNLLAELPLLQ